MFTKHLDKPNLFFLASNKLTFALWYLYTTTDLRYEIGRPWPPKYFHTYVIYYIFLNIFFLKINIFNIFYIFKKLYTNV